MLNNFIQTIYNLADTYWVSNMLGTSEVAAMTLVFPVIFLTLSLGMGINVAGTALISQHTGAQQKKEASKVASQMFAFTLILAVTLSIIGFFATPYIIKAMGGKGDVLKYSTQYLQIMFWEIPGIFMFFVYNSIKQGQGDTLTPMLYNVCGVVLNIILDPFFIERFGIKGAALATIFSRTIFVIIAVYTLFANRNSGIYLRLKEIKIQKDILLKIIKIGFPATIGQSASALGFIILNAFVISYGDQTLAAFGIGNRINSLVLMPVMGIGSALATIIGQNLGANNLERVKLAFITSIKLSTLFMVVGGIILSLSSKHVVGVFIKNDPEVFALSNQYLRIISTSLPLMGFFQVFIGTFQGSGHTIFAMIMDMGRLWGLRIPLILLFRKFASWGPSGVWYAMLLSNAIICVVGLFIYLSNVWQKKVITDNVVAS
ncbi:MATE family efflux transporter [Alkaliphilus serpentinus]|uniref:MATE family efflux transporter n=2 Tax=Alkaliphilus serpentinus TaxID=1482731 RepID=A0A833HPT1_9FIRM|nr:MATE family efflux transporter [Alkaliphilus serpentinus]